MCVVLTVVMLREKYRIILYQACSSALHRMWGFSSIWWSIDRTKKKKKKSLNCKKLNCKKNKLQKIKVLREKIQILTSESKWFGEEISLKFH